MTEERDEVELIMDLITKALPDPEARRFVADVIERRLNRELDALAERYGATEQDCACVIHTGPCWLYYQRIVARHNTDIIRRGGTLAWTGFSREESARYSDLISELERLERKRGEY